jgi:hypothetical protein
MQESSLPPTDPLLALPALEKQWLISPPASPPVGWTQEVEAPPVINYELIERLNQLKASDECEFVCFHYYLVNKIAKTEKYYFIYYFHNHRANVLLIMHKHTTFDSLIFPQT